MLYPTNEKPEKIPYLDPESARLLCAELMKAGAPPPLKSFGWMLETWRFTTIKARRNARPASSTEREGFPIAVYSHGLSGNATIYSYQALNLAANGMVVLQVDHTDKSAIAVKRRDSSHMLYDQSPVTELIANKKEDEYELKRRAQTEHRVEEILSALKVLKLKALNHKNIPDLQDVSFVDKLDTSDVTLIGHSFGGCTVLSAAARKPHLVSAVVAHEPAVSWMPNSARKALFPTKKDEEEKEVQVDKEEEKKDGDQSEDETEGESKSIHDVPMLFLYSEEWAEVGWGAYEQIKSMHKCNKLGPENGTMSEVGVIKKAKHQEFSDTCMLTPLWLARATGLTGERNPHDTAEEIADRTIDFLQATRRKQT